MLTPNPRISALHAIVVTVLFLAGCGSPRTTVDQNTELDEAIVHYIDGDLAKAETLLARFASGDHSNEELATAYLYLGRIYLARGEYEKAADAFSTGQALGGDIRFAEYFEEAQRHLATDPQRIVQLPRITRGQLATLIDEKFGDRLARASAPGDLQGSGAVRSGVMTALPDGSFHAEDAVTAPALYAIIERLAGALGADRTVLEGLFPGGFRATVGAGEGSGAAKAESFVTGVEVGRVLDALGEAVHSYHQ